MIQAQDLEKRFGAAQALKDSTFSVRAGEVFGVGVRDKNLGAVSKKIIVAKQGKQLS